MRLNRRRHKTQVNIVPLVDVLMVLIFFFLVTMQFREQTEESQQDEKVLNITLPKIETAGTNEPDQQVEIYISKDGDYFYNGKSVTPEQFREMVKVSASYGRDIPVLIASDEDTPLKHVTFAMDVCRQGGLEKFKLLSR